MYWPKGCLATLLITVFLFQPCIASSASSTTYYEFQVNSATDGDQLIPRVAGRPDGKFYVLWTNATSQTCRYRLATESGYFVTGETQISSIATAQQSLPSIASFSDGSAFVTWVDNNYNIKWRIINANGKPSGKDVLLLSGNDMYASSCVITLQGGASVFVVTNYQYQPGVFRFYGQEFDRTGNIVASSVLVDSRRLTSGTYTALQAPNGNIFFVQCLSPSELALRFFLLNQNLVTNFSFSDFPLHTSALDQEYLACGAFANNNIFAAWVHVNADGSTQLAGGLFNGYTGRAVKTSINLSSNLYSAVLSRVAGVSSAVFNNGNNMLIVFAAQKFSYSDFDIYGSIVDSSGSVYGPFLINQETAGDQLNPAACALPNGDMFVAWQGNQAGVNNIFGISVSAAQLQSVISAATISLSQSNTGSNSEDGNRRPTSTEGTVMPAPVATVDQAPVQNDTSSAISDLQTKVNVLLGGVGGMVVVGGVSCLYKIFEGIQSWRAKRSAKVRPI